MYVINIKIYKIGKSLTIEKSKDSIVFIHGLIQQLPVRQFPHSAFLGIFQGYFPTHVF